MREATSKPAPYAEREPRRGPCKCCKAPPPHMRVMQPGTSFTDLLSVAAAAARCPFAALSVTRDGNRWGTFTFGIERESLDDPTLFSAIARQGEPVEVADIASDPLFAHTRLARPPSQVRWLLAVPLFNQDGEAAGVLAVLNDRRHELRKDERGALLAVARLAANALVVGHKMPVVRPAVQALSGDGQAFLHSRDVAKLFDVTERTVHNWAATGKLACLRTPGNNLRFRSEDVAALLEAGSRPSRVPAGA